MWFGFQKLSWVYFDKEKVVGKGRRMSWDPAAPAWSLKSAVQMSPQPPELQSLIPGHKYPSLLSRGLDR